ncbi:RlpA-like double-psi beta-barrel-protein domain-containing protein-containing protein [Mycena alexandri]|uniref:RlpA-like double-psi beta-barrel-protein domain-containing protein-containing protein n=1 Tax=Mycena alexandri TaxID=1745969 RepID=A0AAD6WWT0_9AGAR|nr:RlpA-like double-psi beta-barrel-protein domain-containing protein-containing protein [Mycena alexandri]
MLSILSLLLVPAVLAHNISLSGLANLQRRDGSAKFTNYNAGLGACGATNSDSEFVVALSAQDWDNGASCFKEIYITYNGISATAKIVDECMICPHNGLDFSQSLFGHFVGGEQNNLQVGVIHGDWSYGSGPSDDTTTKKATTTKVTTTKAITTSTHTTTTTSHTTTSNSSPTSASVSASVSNTLASESAAASSTSSAGPQNLQDFHPGNTRPCGIGRAGAPCDLIPPAKSSNHALWDLASSFL